MISVAAPIAVDISGSPAPNASTRPARAFPCSVARADAADLPPPSKPIPAGRAIAQVLRAETLAPSMTPSSTPERSPLRSAEYRARRGRRHAQMVKDPLRVAATGGRRLRTAKPDTGPAEWLR